MEKINLNNYEAWFLDYMEGNLSLEQQEDLFAFLDANPELKSELDDDLGEFTLSPEFEGFSAKDSLKVEEGSNLIAMSNVEELMIASVEGQLDIQQENQLDKFIRDNNLTKDYTAYQNTRLQADLSEKLENKNKLKVKPVIIPLYMRVASIAAVGILLIGLALNNRSAESVSGSMNKGVFLASDSKIKMNALPIKNNYDLSLIGIHIDPNKNQDSDDSQRELIIPDQLIVEEIKEDDTSTIDKTPIEKINIENDIVEQTDSIRDNSVTLIENDLSLSGTIEEEPIKLVTDAAGNLFKKDISFTRDKDVESNEYIAYSVNIGKFQFERKKGR